MTNDELGVWATLIVGFVLAAAVSLFPRSFSKLYLKRHQEFFERLFTSLRARISYGIAALAFLALLILLLHSRLTK